MIKDENPLKKNSLKDINLPLFVYLRSQNKKYLTRLQDTEL